MVKLYPLLLACIAFQLCLATRLEVISPYQGAEVPIQPNSLLYELSTLGVDSTWEIASFTFFYYEFQPADTVQVFMTFIDGESSTIGEIYIYKESIGIRWYLDDEIYPGQTYFHPFISSYIPYSSLQWNFFTVTISKPNHYTKISRISALDSFPFRVSTTSELVYLKKPIAPGYSIKLQNTISEYPSIVISSLNIYDYNVCQDNCADLLYFGFLNTIKINREYEFYIFERYLMESPLASVGVSKGEFIRVNDMRIFKWRVEDCEAYGRDVVGFYYRDGSSTYNYGFEVEIEPDDLKLIERDELYVRFDEDFVFEYEFDREITVFCIHDLNRVTDTAVTLPYDLDNTNRRFDYDIYKISSTHTSIQSRYSFSIYYFGIPNTKKIAQPGKLYTYQLTIIQTLISLIDPSFSFSIIDCSTCTSYTNIISISSSALLTIQNPQAPLQFVIQLNINSKLYYSSVDLEFQDNIPAARIQRFDKVHSNVADLFMLRVEFEDDTYGTEDNGSHRMIVNSELDSEMFLENELGYPRYFVWIPTQHKETSIDIEIWNPAHKMAQYSVKVYANTLPEVEEMPASFKQYSGCLWKYSVEAEDGDSDTILYEVYSSLSENGPRFEDNVVSWVSDGSTQRFTIKVSDDTYSYIDEEFSRNEWVREITLTNDGTAPTVIMLYHYCKISDWCVIDLSEKIYLTSSIKHEYLSAISDLKISSIYSYILSPTPSVTVFDLTLLDQEYCNFIRPFTLYMLDDLIITPIPTIYYTSQSSITFLLSYSGSSISASLYLYLLPTSPSYSIDLDTTTLSWNNLNDNIYTVKIISSKEELKLMNYVYFYTMVTTMPSLNIFSDDDLIVLYSIPYRLPVYSCIIYIVITNTESDFLYLLYYDLESSRGAEVCNVSGVIYWNDPIQDDTVTITVYHPAHWIVKDLHHISPHDWSLRYTFKLNLSYYAEFTNIDPSYLMVYSEDKVEFPVRNM
jgi:hypothetical protein